MRERIWSTTGVAARDQLPLWEHVASEAFVDVSVSAATNEDGFPSSVAARSFGGVDISRIVTRPQTVERRSAQIAADPGDKLFVNLPLTPGTSARQAGRRAVLRPYDFVIVDSAAPFHLAFEGPLHQVSVALHHDLLMPRLPHLEKMTATRVDGTAGLGALASQTLRTLATMSGPLDQRAARALGFQAAELLALALGAAPTVETRRSVDVILHAARDEVERALSDPNLSPALVAGRVGVSVRYLHQVFSAQGASFGRWVLGRRLTRCYAALVDPTQAEETIGDICAEHGLLDPSYFARAFRTAYGATPSEVRARAAVGRPDRDRT
jgi:AraC-like DNA-binding protein